MGSVGIFPDKYPWRIWKKVADPDWNNWCRTSPVDLVNRENQSPTSSKYHHAIENLVCHTKQKHQHQSVLLYFVHLEEKRNEKWLFRISLLIIFTENLPRNNRTTSSSVFTCRNLFLRGGSANILMISFHRVISSTYCGIWSRSTPSSLSRFLGFTPFWICFCICLKTKKQDNYNVYCIEFLCLYNNSCRFLLQM